MQLNICQSQRNILDKQQSFACFCLCEFIYWQRYDYRSHSCSDANILNNNSRCNEVKCIVKGLFYMCFGICYPSLFLLNVLMFIIHCYQQFIKRVQKNISVCVCKEETESDRKIGPQRSFHSSKGEYRAIWSPLRLDVSQKSTAEY